jgi:hypothetical protein
LVWPKIHAGVYVLQTTIITPIPACKHVFFNPYLLVHRLQRQVAMTASNKTTAAKASAASDANRQRRAHKKSRRGCSSCKLRRVKCDERRPACKNCRDFGVACTYDGKISELSFAGESSFSLNDLSAPGLAKANTEIRSLGVVRTQRLSKLQRLSESSAVLAQLTGLPSPPDSDEGNSSHAFGKYELEIFQRFNERTVLSVGSSQTSQIYQREIVQLACCVSRVRPRITE